MTESIYTVHITTLDTHEPHLIEGNEASGVHHMGEHISKLLFEVCACLLHSYLDTGTLTVSFQVMDHVGHDKFSSISSNSTGNTKLACEIVAKAVPMLIVLPDVCHLLNNTAKDIQKLEYFNQVYWLHC